MLEMLTNCGWNSVLCLFCLDYGLYVMHLSHSNAHDLVFALVLWMFALLSSNCTTKTLKYLFYLIEFIEIMLACSSIVWEQILAQTESTRMLGKSLVYIYWNFYFGSNKVAWCECRVHNLYAIFGRIIFWYFLECWYPI